MSQPNPPSDAPQLTFGPGHLTLVTRDATRHIRLSRIRELEVSQRGELGGGRWAVSADLVDGEVVPLAAYGRRAEAEARAAELAPQIFAGGCGEAGRAS